MHVSLAVAAALAAALSAAPVDPAADARAAWAAFVQRPTPRTHERVVQAVGACADASCRRSVAPEPQVIARLVKLVDVGQPVAVEAAMEAYRLVEGPEQVAIGQALGEYVDVQPTRFLRKAKEHRLSAAELAGIVRTLPKGADGDAARQDALERRRHALAGVDAPDVSAERTVALEGLATAAARQGRTPPRVGNDRAAVPAHRR